MKKHFLFYLLICLATQNLYSNPFLDNALTRFFLRKAANGAQAGLSLILPHLQHLAQTADFEALWREALPHGFEAAFHACIHMSDRLNARQRNGLISRGINQLESYGLNHFLAWIARSPHININAIDKNGDTVLLAVTRRGLTPIVKALIARGANVNLANKYDGTTALELAEAGGHRDIAKVLRKNGADINISLLIASALNHPLAIDALIAKGANINTSDKFGESPLMIASKNGFTDSIKVFLDKKVNPNSPNQYNGNTPLIFAASGGHTNAVKMLVSAKATVNSGNMQGTNSLLASIMNGHDEVAKYLLEQEANPNVTNINSETPITIAAEKGNGDMVSLLRKRGVNIRKALSEAARRNNAKGARALTHYLNVNDELINAAKCGDIETIDILLQSGADINCYSRSWGILNRYTPLMMAISQRDLNTVAYLLYKGANIDLIVDKNNALILAVQLRLAKIVQILVDSGANVDLFPRDSGGPGSPLWIAESNRYSEIIDILVNAGATVREEPWSYPSAPTPPSNSPR